MNDEVLWKLSGSMLKQVDHVPDLREMFFANLRQVRDAERAELKHPSRLLDLVRYQRAELHRADLITDEEYAELCSITDSPKRLEDYDKLQAQLASAQQERERWRQDFGRLAIERDDLVVALEAATKGKL